MTSILSITQQFAKVRHFSIIDPCQGVAHLYDHKHYLELDFIIAVSIDVPWGQISGKAWDSPNGQPVLSSYGMDQLIT